MANESVTYPGAVGVNVMVTILDCPGIIQMPMLLYPFVSDVVLNGVLNRSGCAKYTAMGAVLFGSGEKLVM